ncbi:MAG: sulfotransferase [Rhizomicrobium sp.]
MFRDEIRNARQAASADQVIAPAEVDKNDTALLGLDPELQRAFNAVRANNFVLAEQILRGFVDAHETDVNGLKLLAELLLRRGDQEGAEALLARCLEIAPDFAAARHRYASMLVNASRLGLAKEQLEILLRHDSRNLTYRSLMAYTLGQAGDYAPALELHKEIVREVPDQPAAWIVYANDLRAAGRVQECVDAYRHAIALQPENADAYWNLSNLKTFQFSDEEIDRMHALLTRTDIAPRSRSLLHFCLGKACEDQAKFDDAFAHFRKANALQRSLVAYDADQTTRSFAEIKAVFSSDFLSKRSIGGCNDSGPIFIVGLPRSGSTLVEQILSSHSAIEGTRELPYVQAKAARIEGGFPRGIFNAAPQMLADMGRAYLEETKNFRMLGRPFFTDKMPSNFAFASLIRLMLPNARIIDVRRDPLDCCLANFKHAFSRAFAFSYSLGDLGRYYRDYVDLMDHYDRVIPGFIYRVDYESLVADPEKQVRRMFEYLGLPFEPGCLRFYENERAVRTASSEQVRMPIFQQGVGSWRRYEAHLAPLKAALG